ncbi:Beta-ketoacyl synthase, N-terminal domain family protein [Leishmania donovani]|uniref:beta-ketoacyl-[acyl-carrier-protein] synthase I n=2 Tax=Leishmania donovani TaxID=5661 RepID=A0A504Y0A8_LEIDO|nr:Beta-ketoacyl synthase, N-terminal domain family protein [Leishmania donovani]
MGFGALPTRTPRRVVVTGIGMVTPLGVTAVDTWAAVCRGQSGCRPLIEAPYFLPGFLENDKMLSPQQKAAALEKLVAALPCKVAAFVQPPAEVGLAAGKVDKAVPAADPFAPTAHEPRALRLCARAVEEALADAALQLSEAVQDRCGVNIGMGIPSLADVTDVSAYLTGDAIATDAGHVHYSKVPPMFLPKILGNMAAGNTAIRHKLRGPIGSSVAACATGAHCIGEAALWIREGRADVMVCGAAEACITPVSVAGFTRMRALCTRFNDTPSSASRPFDITRAGFVMGEGAGVLILEALEHAVARAAPRVYAELRGFGISCDAHHVAVPHPEGLGARRCVEQALAEGGDVPASAVGYVNAHATGTIGDEVELMAIQQALRPSTAPSSPALHVSSAKGGLGHLLGAAGSVEAALTVLALHEQRAPPTANLTTSCLTREQQECGLVCIQGSTAQPMQSCEAVISTSFGFGGINTALLFTRM